MPNYCFLTHFSTITSSDSLMQVLWILLIIFIGVMGACIITISFIGIGRYIHKDMDKLALVCSIMFSCIISSVGTAKLQSSKNTVTEMLAQDTKYSGNIYTVVEEKLTDNSVYALRVSQIASDAPYVNDSVKAIPLAYEVAVSPQEYKQCKEGQKLVFRIVNGEYTIVGWDY